MDPRTQYVFLLLILAQGAHSIEEYAGRLYEIFAPARFVSGLLSSDLSVGFLAVNAALVTFGLWCWAVPVRAAGPGHVRWSGSGRCWNSATEPATWRSPGREKATSPEWRQHPFCCFSRHG